MTKQEQFVIILLILAALIGTGLLYHNKFSQDVPKPEVVESKNEKLFVDAKKEVLVDVKGACWRPGVYALPYGARAKDAIEKACPRNDADLDDINLARRLDDGESIYIATQNPSHSEDTVASVTDVTKNYKDDKKHFEKININNATKEELEKLPGIGPKIAGYIIEYKNANGPFKEISDIKKIERVGEKTFEKIKDMITVK